MLVLERQHRHVDRALRAVLLEAHRASAHRTPALLGLEQRGAQFQPQAGRHQGHKVARRFAACMAQPAAGLLRDVDDLGMGVHQDAGRRLLRRLVQVDLGEGKQPAPARGRRRFPVFGRQGRPRFAHRHRQRRFALPDALAW